MIKNALFYLFLLGLLSACSQPEEPQYDFDTLLNAYGEVWNTGDMAPLDTLVSDSFELRYNSSGPLTGVAPLIGSIQATRNPFDDFELKLKEKFIIDSNVCLITWEITGKRKTDGEAFGSEGFSVIFHGDGKITGEWISYSDVGWLTGLGYDLVPPGGGN